MTTSLIRAALRAVLAVAALALAAAAQAQVKPALVRSVDEPARVPYTQQIAPTCIYTNECTASFPTVPAGMRLRITNVQALFFFDNFSAFLAVHDGPTQRIVLLFPMTEVGAGYYGGVSSLTQPVDLTYEAGETPLLEFGTGAGNTIYLDVRNLMGVSGYLVSTTP